MSKRNVLFLYTELAGYTINSMKNAMIFNSNLQIHVVRWKSSSEAPFQFDFGDLKLYQRSDFDLDKLTSLVVKENIQTIIISGWVDKEYVKLCRLFNHKIPTVLIVDNQWDGSLKQRIAQVLSSWLIKRNFSHAWVPGDKQFELVKRLGIKAKSIKKGFYVADTKLFTDYYEKFKSSKEDKYPKRFIYVGRYVKHKGIFDLWNAFVKLHEENDTDWELWCVGTGEEYENKLSHPKIKHFGFLQPNEFSSVIENTGVYILSSHFEPWGVSVQEFAAAGYPMLLSNQIGSSERFLVENENGYSFESNDVDGLVTVMKKMISLSEKELLKMQLKSIKLSSLITVKEWSNSLLLFKL
jgi:glycosyltransferase involved in cell wall biosynthesis